MSGKIQREGGRGREREKYKVKEGEGGADRQDGEITQATEGEKEGTREEGRVGFFWQVCICVRCSIRNRKFSENEGDAHLSSSLLRKDRRTDKRGRKTNRMNRGKEERDRKNERQMESKKTMKLKNKDRCVCRLK